MRKNTPVSAIMTRNLVTAHITDSLRYVSRLLNEHHVRHIPVVSGKKLAGIVSQSDIMRLSFGDMFDGQEGADETVFDMLKLEQVMMSHPDAVREDDSIKDVAEKFTNVSFHALPVVNENNDIVGIVSTTDLIKYLLAQYS